MDELLNRKDNIISGFRKCGIHPLNRSLVLDRLPNFETANNTNSSVSEVFLVHFQQLRHSGENEPSRKRRKRLDIVPGKSVGEPNTEQPSTSNPTTKQAEQTKYLSDSSDRVSDSNINTTMTETFLMHLTFK